MTSGVVSQSNQIASLKPLRILSFGNPMGVRTYTPDHNRAAGGFQMAQYPISEPWMEQTAASDN